MEGCDVRVVRRKYDTSQFDQSELSNGIRVWTQEPHILTDEGGTLGAFLPRVGSYADPPHARGTAHFLEHLSFTGLAHRKLVEERGGILGAGTSRMWINYYVDLPQDDFDLAAETLSELLHPRLTEENLTGEKGVIAEEYRGRYGAGDRLRDTHFWNLLFGDHPLAHYPIGTIPHIEGMNLGVIEDFYRAHYHAGNINLVCGGSFAKIPGVCDALERRFGNMPNGLPTRPALPAPPILSKRGERIEAHDPRYGKDSITMIYAMNPMRTLEVYTLGSIADALGRGQNSLLFRELRDKRGLIYGAKCWLLVYPCVWAFGIELATESKNFAVVENVVLDVLGNMRGGYLRAHKRSRELSRRTAFTHPIEACNTLAERIAAGLPISQWETESVEDLVTLQEVRRVQSRLLGMEPIICEAHAS